MIHSIRKVSSETTQTQRSLYISSETKNTQILFGNVARICWFFADSKSSAKKLLVELFLDPEQSSITHMSFWVWELRFPNGEMFYR